jgi:hypothetical protein
MRSSCHHSGQVPVYIINILTRQASNPLTSHSGPATVALRPFASDAGAIRHIAVHVTRPAANRLVLDYELQGDVAGVRLPESDPFDPHEEPTDGLWRHTCMEVFVSAASPGSCGDYLEFNLAPSGQWAAYRFSGYRAGMTPLRGLAPPRIRMHIEAEQLRLNAQVTLPAQLAAGDLRLGVSAVVEESQGSLSYWALRHAAERPDFHHPDGFGLEI